MKRHVIYFISSILFFGITSTMTLKANSIYFLSKNNTANPNIPIINKDHLFVNYLKYNSSKLLTKELTVSTHSLTIGASEGSTTLFNIISNVIWIVEISQTWLTSNLEYGNGNGSIILTASANQTAINRTAMVTVQGPGVDDQLITVTQLAGSTAVDIIENNQSVKVFPNPSFGNFTIELNNFNNNKITVRICDVLGNILINNKLENLPVIYRHKIDMCNANNGTYFIIIQTNKTKIVNSIVLLKK